MAQNLADTVKYIEGNSFEGMVFDDPRKLQIRGRQFAFARVSDYAQCRSIDAIVKYIEEQGGVVRANAVKSADYLIITPSPTGESFFVYKEEQEKYDKALEYRMHSSKPQIIRDVDFYITTDLFAKLAIDDKRRIVMELVNGNPNFNDKSRKKVSSFLLKNINDDVYFRHKNTSGELNLSGLEEEVSSAQLFLPDEDTCRDFTLGQWRKYLSVSKSMFREEKCLILKKCKVQNKTIVIPDMIEGLPVNMVESKAFSDIDSSVEEVILPHTLRYLAECSFLRCPSLRRIVIRAPRLQCGIHFLGFARCPNLQEIIVDGINIVCENRSGCYLQHLAYTPIT